MTNSQLDTTNESQEVSPSPAVDHKAHINRHAQRHSKRKTEKSINDPQKKFRLASEMLGVSDATYNAILVANNRCVDQIPIYGNMFSHVGIKVVSQLSFSLTHV